MNKLVKLIGLSFAIFFLLGLATTLTRSMMIGFQDVLPVYILMILAISMMLYEAFFDKKINLIIRKFTTSDCIMFFNRKFSLDLNVQL